MMYRTRRPRLKQQTINEIHHLATHGCPCCGEPLSHRLLANAYGTSPSSVSRIMNNSYRSYPLDLTIREQVKLVKEVRARAGQT